jgi:cytochrome b561
LIVSHSVATDTDSFDEPFEDTQPGALRTDSTATATFRQPVARHSRATIFMHWSSVTAILLAVALVLIRELVEEKTARVIMLDMHRQLGLAVLLLLLLRLGARARGGLVAHTSGMPVLMQLAAAAAHWVLYGTLLLITLLGWALTSAHAVGIKFLGIVPLPALAGSDSDLADLLTDYHIWASWLLLGLVMLHIGAALYHHFIRRDGVLLAMLPKSSRPLRVHTPNFNS